MPTHDATVRRTVPGERVDWGAVPGLKAVANPTRYKPRRRADGAWQPQPIPNVGMAWLLDVIHLLVYH
jgi:hypothetical protein